MPRRGAGPEIVTIYWRDIPAQVNGQVGRERHQVVLSTKFQRAIDRAKRTARIDTAADDVAQWRRTTVSCDGDIGAIGAAAEAAASLLEEQFSREYLGRLAYAGGHVAALGDATVPRDVLSALEELEPDRRTESAT